MTEQLGLTREPCPDCGCPGEQYDGHVCEDFVAEDRNADLVGFAFEGITVEGSAPWDPAYVLVRGGAEGPSCRPAALVRARMLSA